MAKFKQADYKLIEKLCKELDINLSDPEMSKIIVKNPKFKEYNTMAKFDSLRRSVSFVRTFCGLRNRVDREKMLKDYLRLRKQYPDASKFSLAAKLQLLYPVLKVHTLKDYICKYENYGVFKT